VITYLRANPAIADGIAQRQRELYVNGGYLSMAAETCYWRGLFHGWSGVAMIPAEAEEGSWGNSTEIKGMRWETFALTGKTSWD